MRLAGSKRAKRDYLNKGMAGSISEHFREEEHAEEHLTASLYWLSLDTEQVCDGDDPAHKAEER